MVSFVEIIGFIITMVICCFMGLGVAYVFGGILAPKVRKRALEKRSEKRIEEQIEKGYTYFDGPEEVGFKKKVEEDESKPIKK